MLYYLPLEQYPERYTMMMSCKGGWAEDWFARLGVEFVRIDGTQLNQSIKNGVVLDACGRSYYANTQINQVVRLINDGAIKDGDVIYTEDFWHPSIESLFYIRHMTGIKFKVGCFLHAQSVDDTDFAYAMRDWMRPIEQGFGKQYDYIFVCSKILKSLCVDNGIGTDETVHVVGLPYNSECLTRQLDAMGMTYDKKEPYVIFSSRFDAEKDPNFFLDLVEACPDIEFRLVNPRKTAPISNDPNVVERLQKVLSHCKNLQVVDTSNKIEYYRLLQRAKVQLNCAHQDWVSWTLLEAVTFGCLPLYPIWKDFPLELRDNPKYLYEKGNLDECKKKLYALMQTEVSYDMLGEHDFIVKKHDESWNGYLTIMGLI